MSYFIIKCPYCLQELTNNDVLFNLKDVAETRKREIRELIPVQHSEVDAFTYSEDTDFTDGVIDESNDAGYVPSYLADKPAGNEGSEVNIGHAHPTTLPVDGYYTYLELLKLFGEKNVLLTYNENIRVPHKLKNDNCNGGLLTAVEIKTQDNGEEITTRYVRRYCECKKVLKNSAGLKDSRVILMLGSAKSGKTTFLCALYEALAEGAGYMFPPKETGSRPIIKLTVTVLSGGTTSTTSGDIKLSDTSLESMATKLFSEGELPHTTLRFDNEPLVLDIGVQFENGKSSSTLLFLRDAPGEAFIDVSSAERLYEIAPQFPKFDGFILMLDPFSFKEKEVFSTVEVQRMEKDSKYILRLGQVFSEIIAPFVGGSRIDKTTAVIITKVDHFFDRRNRQKIEQKGVEFSFPTLSSYQNESYDKHFFKEIDQDVEKILTSLSPNILNMLINNFSKIFYSFVSALSREPIAMEHRETVKIANGKEEKYLGTFVNENELKPWRVTDPFIRMLMRLNVIPPFDRVEIRQEGWEKREDLLAMNAKYIEAINNWGRNYFVPWDDIAGDKLSMPQINEPKPAPRTAPRPRGWFRR